MMRSCHPGRCQDHQQTRRRGNGPEQWRKKGEAGGGAGGIDGKDGDTGMAEVEEDREGTNQYRTRSSLRKGMLTSKSPKPESSLWKLPFFHSVAQQPVNSSGFILHCKFY